MSTDPPADAPTDDLVTRARAFATEAHARLDQRRKYTQQPYVEHLKAVAAMVAEVVDDPQLVAAAWLHDTVEDTTATYGDVERAFGHEVAQLVAELTDVSRPGDGNRSVRKAIDLHHAAQASARAQTVKLADLTDNCRDICRNDAAFARVYLPEAAALLGVLTQGDPALYRRAQKAVAEGARRLGLPRPSQTLHDGRSPAPRPQVSLSQRRAQRVFMGAFTARDIAEPLRAVDLQHDARALADLLEQHATPVAGLRRDGLPAGWVRAYELGDGPASTWLRPFADGQVLAGDAPLSAVVGVLFRYDYCFVSTLGEVGGVITRANMQQPIVRMWLFGIVTLLEMDMTQRIRHAWPAGEWTRALSAARLDKAQALLEERQRRGQQPELLDCLQLGDKAAILMQDAAQLAAFGFETKGAAQRVVKDLESLRNHLAHAQDIVTHDWVQIARLAAQLEDALALAA